MTRRSQHHLSLFLLCFALIAGWDSNECMTDAQRLALRDEVKDMFYHAYDNYMHHAFPLDELRPLTCGGRDTWGYNALTLIDALDTLVIMGNNTEFTRAVDWVCIIKYYYNIILI